MSRTRSQSEEIVEYLTWRVQRESIKKNLLEEFIETIRPNNVQIVAAPFQPGPSSSTTNVPPFQPGPSTSRSIINVAPFQPGPSTPSRGATNVASFQAGPSTSRGTTNIRPIQPRPSTSRGTTNVIAYVQPGPSTSRGTINITSVQQGPSTSRGTSNSEKVIIMVPQRPGSSMYRARPNVPNVVKSSQPGPSSSQTKGKHNMSVLYSKSKKENKSPSQQISDLISASGRVIEKRYPQKVSQAKVNEDITLYYSKEEGVESAILRLTPGKNIQIIDVSKFTIIEEKPAPKTLKMYRSV